jgi:DNA modification methylase
MPTTTTNTAAAGVVLAEHDVTLYQGDAREVLAALPGKSVHCVVTSPPYFGLRDYAMTGQIGQEPTPGEYVAGLVDVFAQISRVLRPDGTAWLNLGDSYSSAGGHTDHGQTSTLRGRRVRVMHTSPATRADRPAKSLLGMPWRVAFALQDAGWLLRNAIVWHKPNAMPESVTDRLATRHELLFLLTRSPRYWFDLDAIKIPTTGRAPGNTAEGLRAYGVATGTGHGARRFGGNPTSTLLEVHQTRNPGDVWTIPTAGYPGAHFATFPPDLAARCVLAGCPLGGVVLDPFAGAGTTLLIARRLLRRSIGVELNPDYCRLAADRLGPAPLDFGQVPA